MSWLPWLAFDGLSPATSVYVPALFVHSDSCVFPDHIETLRRRLRGPVDVAWGEDTQTDFYDHPAQMAFALDAVAEHFSATLTAREEDAA